MYRKQIMPFLALMGWVLVFLFITGCGKPVTIGGVAVEDKFVVDAVQALDVVDKTAGGALLVIADAVDLGLVPVAVAEKAYELSAKVEVGLLEASKALANYHAGKGDKGSVQAAIDAVRETLKELLLLSQQARKV